MLPQTMSLNHRHAAAGCPLKHGKLAQWIKRLLVGRLRGYKLESMKKLPKGRWAGRERGGMNQAEEEAYLLRS